MTEKEIIKQLLNIIAQSTLNVQGAALGKLMQVLAYAEQMANAKEPASEPSVNPGEGADGGAGDAD